MDMRNTLGVWLTGAVVHALGDRYTGTIVEVVRQEVRNRWTKRTALECVVVFTDGKQLVLNRGMQLALIERFGHESDEWVGRRIALTCRRLEHIDAKTGKLLVTWRKILVGAEDARDAEDPVPGWVTEPELDSVSDTVVTDDEDDRYSQPRRVARRRG